MYFRYFIIISPCKRTWPLICTNLNPLHQRISCANKLSLVKIGLMLFEKILNFCQHNITISLLFSSGKDLNKPESSIFTQLRVFCAKLNLAMQLRLENKMKKGNKFTDRRQNTGDLKSSIKLLAKVS